MADTPMFSLDDTADALIEEVPEPQQHAIDQAKEDAASAQPGDPAALADSSVELDALGVPWDPNIHATGKDGKGVRTAKNTWRKRRGVSGSASHLNTGAANANKEPSPEELASRSEAEQRATAEKQARIAGVMCAQLFERTCIVIGGDEFEPRIKTIPGTSHSYHEHDFLSQSFGDYFVAKGAIDIPPGVVLASAIMMYVAPRFKEPPVQERFSRIKGFFRRTGEWLYFKFKYRGKRAPERTDESRGRVPANIRGVSRPQAPDPLSPSEI